MSKKGGHHGGAWKVAYADFITAMMALFLVLWLTAQDEKIKEAVQRAFTHPFGSITKESVGIIPSDKAQAVQNTKGNFDSASAVELTMLRRLNEDLLKALQPDENPENRTVELQTTSEGLRISIFDRSRRPVFEPQSAEFTPYGEWVVSTLAWPISHYTNFFVEVEGHTEKGHPPIRESYGDWELSTDRANTARRKLIEHGVTSPQVQKVAGYADTQPLPAHLPEDEANRRVTVMLRIRNAGSPG
jgi:chemotaxis protein MotB